MGLRWHGTSVDALDPARLGRWWAEVLGVRVLYEKQDVVVLPGLTFVRARAAKTARNRLHFELACDDLAADVERLVDMGARHVEGDLGELERIVLADPEGNEFCVLTAGR
jgi:predicted enzyme related to lactoylglutathione lyase